MAKNPKKITQRNNKNDSDEQLLVILENHTAARHKFFYKNTIL